MKISMELSGFPTPLYLYASTKLSTHIVSISSPPLCIFVHRGGRRGGYSCPTSLVSCASPTPSPRTTFSIPLRSEFGIGRERPKRRVVLVRANGGGAWDKATTRRLLGNLAFAAGLTYLSVTGQLGWVLDAIVSIWVLALILPIVGIAAFFYFAGQDIVQGTCPNCGNDFQIFKSSLTDGPQLCPYCSQPFSVVDNKFVRESASFSSEKSPRFTQAFNGFSPSINREKATATSTTIVDIEAEVKDAD